jgi:hypothetical protein
MRGSAFQSSAEEKNMSTVVYAATTERREDSPVGTSTNQERPGLGTWVDVLVALVPAEVLAAHALVLNWAMKTSADANGDQATVITNPNLLKVAFWVLIGVAAFLYLIKKKGRLVPLDALRAAIPALAFVGWTMLQQSTAFDAMFPDFDHDTRYFLAVVAAIVIAAAAQRLAVKADNEPPAG